MAIKGQSKEPQGGQDRREDTRTKKKNASFNLRALFIFLVIKELFRFSINDFSHHKGNKRKKIQKTILNQL